MIKKADEKTIARAVKKGILKANTKELELNNFTVEVEDNTTRFGTAFKEKGRLKMSVYDTNMNQVWEKDFGKVSGEWSTVLPEGAVKESGEHYVLFKQGKKAKLLLLGLE